MVFGVSAATPSLAAQSGMSAEQLSGTVSPVPNRVRGRVTGEVTTLKGQTRRLGPSAVDLGQAPATLATGRMVLWLRRSADQQARVGQYLSQAQNPASPVYRHWMNPAAYGAAYGISDHDLAAVVQWLQSSGLKVEGVSAARNAVIFSGTTGSVGAAFHTSIHRYTVGGRQHLANVGDPQVPAALAPVIAGVSPMNDFRAHPLHVLGKTAHYDSASHHLQPSMNGGDAANGYDLFVTPADASILYDTPNRDFNPSAKQTLDGTGVTIGILGYSALAMADVQNYRTAFLPAAAAANLPTPILDGATDPGVLNGGDAEEALLDVEMAGGLAPSAAIDYYYAASTELSDGLVLAGLRALEDNKVSILSVSYGACEADLGVGGNLAWSELWQQAAAQGITVTVSTGDSGSAACDGDTVNKPSAASLGLSVNGIASTPYNVAVGGTDFYALSGNFSTYVNTSNSGSYPYYATALSYIPENPWNDSSNDVGNFSNNSPVYNGVGETNITGGGGGLSSKAVCSGNINADGSCSQSLSGYSQPAFQNGFEGLDPVRAVPDVSLLAANGFYGAIWVFCSDSTVDEQGGLYTDCRTDSSGHLLDGAQVGLVGGTSASAPAFAGMLAMVAQSQHGARLGQADTVLYNLAQDYNPSPSTPGKYQQAFHDITAGNNSVYCNTGTLDCGSNNFLNGYDANPSYDMATGLGSVDLSQLIKLWPTASLTATTNTLTAGTSSDSLSAAAITVTHGTPLTFSTEVTPTDAGGQFSIVSTNSANAASFSDFGSLDGNGAGSLTANDLPGGTYTVYAYYAGDTSHTGSQSSNGISVTIGPEPSTTTLAFGAYDPVSNAVTEGLSTVPYGAGTYLNAQPFGNSSTTSSGSLLADGLATGSVTFTGADGKTQSAAINSLGLAQLPASSLAPGTYRYTASYAGDASFKPSTSPAETLTVTQGATAWLLQSSASAVSPVDQLQVSGILTTDSIAAYPTGSVTAQVNGHSYTAVRSSGGTYHGADANQVTFSIPVSDLVPGTNRITVNYSGDGNYQASSASTMVTLIGQAGSFTLSGPGQPLVVEAAQQGSTTVSIVPSDGFTGQVSMSCSVSAASSGHTPLCQAGSAIVYGSFGATTPVNVSTFPDTPAGSYTLTVTGTGEGVSQTVQIPLTVTSGPGFSLTSSAGSLSIASPGQSANNTLTLAPLQGFTGTVLLHCLVVPAPGSGSAPTCTVPASVVLGAAGASASLQIDTGQTTTPGSYSVAVTAVSGSLEQTLALPLLVGQTAASPTFALSAQTSDLSIAVAGQSVTDTLALRPAGGFTGAVQLSCTVAAGSSGAAAPTCAVPATVSVTGSSVVNATLTVSSTGSSSTALMTEFGGRLGAAALCGLLIFVAPRRRRGLAALGLLLLTVGGLGITGCGGGHSSPGGANSGSAGTPAGAYAVTVTAVSGALTTSTQVNVTVQ